MLRNAHDIHAALRLAGSDAASLCQQYGSPVYLYDAATIRRQLTRLSAALDDAQLSTRCHIHYAIKANDRLGILQILQNSGTGADLVSIGELHRALRAGFSPDQLIYSGVGKTADDLRCALTHGIGQINVESLAEVHMLEHIATTMGVTIRVAFRLNPDTRAGGHEHISTGAAEHKFGFSPKEVTAAIALAQKSAVLNPVGIALHLGSQIHDVTAYAQAFERLNLFLNETQAALNFTPEILDLGGGLAIDYVEGQDIFDVDGYARCVKQAFGHRHAKLLLEPGRFLVGPSGILLMRTLLEKQAGIRRWVIVEMAMNDLMRPALYQAKHRLSLLSDHTGTPSPAWLGGPVCESTDTLGEYNLPPCPTGSILALHDVGAYGSVMANNYNARHLPTELLLDNDQIHVLRRAITADDWMAFEKPLV